MSTEGPRALPLPWLLLLLALLARLFAWGQWCGGMVWPDEIFQSVEPAHHLAFGLGALAWEWDAGARSWLPPLFFAVPFRLQAALGLDGAGQLLWGARLLSLLVSLMMVWGAWRIGQREGGKLGAWLAGVAAALSPPLLFYAPRTLNDGPAAALVVWGLVLAGETEKSARHERAALLAGLLAGLAYIFRYTSVIFFLVPGGYLLLSRRFRDARAMLLGFGTVAVAGGLVDWLTWGKPFQSIWVNLKFNLIDGLGAQLFGAAPFGYYAGILHRDLGVLALVAVVVAVVGGRALPALALSVAVALILMSLTQHKEERFLLPIWALMPPLLALGCERLSRRLPRGRGPAAVAGLALLLASQAWALGKSSWSPQSKDLFEAMDFIARQNDVRGIAAHHMWTTTSGFVGLHDKNVPLVANESLFELEGGGDLVRHELINYIIADSAAQPGLRAIIPDASLLAIARFGDVVVWRKAPLTPP